MKKTKMFFKATIMMITILILLTILSSCVIELPLIEIYFSHGQSEVFIGKGYPDRYTISGKGIIKEDIIFYSEDESILKYDHRGDDPDSHDAYFMPIAVGVTKVHAITAKSRLKAEMTVTVKEIPYSPSPGYLHFYGSGTKEDPYQLQTQYDVNNISNLTYDLTYGALDEKEIELVGDYFEGVYFALTNDIVYNKDAIGPTIFKQTNWFRGEIDGRGYSITVPDEAIKEHSFTAYDMAMFFALEETAVIKNLTLNIFLTVDEFNPDHLDYMSMTLDNGLLASFNRGLIENCVVKGVLKIKNRASYAYGNLITLGGIVSSNYGIIRNCISDVDIVIDGYANSRNKNNPYYDKIGGIAGYNVGIINNCIYTGGIKYKLRENGSQYYIGVLIGKQDGTTEGFLKDNVNELYFDINSLDIRTETEIHPNYPDDITPYTIAQEKIAWLEGEVGDNIGGVSDWSVIDFSSWDHNLWDFSGAIPELSLFKK